MDIILVDEETLQVGEQTFRCAVGKNGLVEADAKREGDLKTPRGTYPLRACYWRPDKLNEPPQTALPLVEIRPDMGWCDDPAHPRYNQLVSLPFDASRETLWREDDCYDLIVPIGYNDDPIIAGKGSAIFLHVAKPGYEGTEGCVALAKADMFEVVTKLHDRSAIEI